MQVTEQQRREGLGVLLPLRRVLRSGAQQGRERKAPALSPTVTGQLMRVM